MLSASMEAWNFFERIKRGSFVGDLKDSSTIFGWSEHSSDEHLQMVQLQTSAGDWDVIIWNVYPMDWMLNIVKLDVFDQLSQFNTSLLRFWPGQKSTGPVAVIKGPEILPHQASADSSSQLIPCSYFKISYRSVWYHYGMLIVSAFPCCYCKFRLVKAANSRTYRHFISKERVLGRKRSARDSSLAWNSHHNNFLRCTL